MKLSDLPGREANALAALTEAVAGRSATDQLQGGWWTVADALLAVLKAAEEIKAQRAELLESLVSDSGRLDDAEAYVRDNFRGDWLRCVAWAADLNRIIRGSPGTGPTPETPRSTAANPNRSA